MNLKAEITFQLIHWFDVQLICFNLRTVVIAKNHRSYSTYIQKPYFFLSKLLSEAYNIYGSRKKMAVSLWLNHDF